MNIPEIFGSEVFGESVMKERLDEKTYSDLKRTTESGEQMSRETAAAVASAMKDWAIEKGATHFTHWFQPMTGITAEKHDSFISPAENGQVIMDFSYKELIKGEADASSFPSGGLRATFEARGYTAWDTTSYAFIKDNTLCIPTAFCSYMGEALDKKTPLLRSMNVLNREALRILRIFGDNETGKVKATVGPEQEYFLVDKELYEKREDLMICGRTLFGSKPPKGQELDDHYYGAIKPRILNFMKDLDKELWKLGIYAKTEHNEAAPAQHELAPVFTTTNIATDHNQLTMEIMKKVALRHGLVCLLHEKPFEGVNGSGKHNNWSMSTDKGENLLNPGKTPENNARFLLFFAAVIKAVDEHQDLLRISVATAGNDCRLGGNEAPPAIISMFIGDELQEILNAIEDEREYHGKGKVKMQIGVDELPLISKDTTDRNRTSPFAFTGNKFEFRMAGSSLSVAGPNIVLNTIVADVLRGFADRIEAAEDRSAEIHNVIKETVKNHKRILFAGNNYSKEWEEEAHRRGLLNLKSTVDALPYYMKKENIELFERNGILTGLEVKSRYEIGLEVYSKDVNIEARTMVDMIRQQILPSVNRYMKDLAVSLSAKKSVSATFSKSFETKLLKKLSSLADELYDNNEQLAAVLEAVPSGASLETAVYYKEVVLKAMAKARTVADEIEKNLGREYAPFPSYADLLFKI